MKLNKYQILFLCFLILNVFKLTGVQWFITRSDYPFFLVLIKNFFFLSLFWSIILFIKNRYLYLFTVVIQFLYLLIHNTYHIYVEHTLNLFQIIYSFSEGITSIRTAIALLNNPLFYFPFIDIVLIFLVFKNYHFIFRKINVNSSIKILFIPFLSLVVFVSAGLFTNDFSQLHFKDRNFKYGTILAQFYDLSRDQQEIIDNIQYGDYMTAPRKEKQYNIVMIQVESLNADLIGFTYKNQEITPFLNKIANENIYYPFLIPQHKSGGSSDAEFSIFNSIEAIKGFPAANFSEYDYPNSFIKQLYSYNCSAFHGNTGNFFNRNKNLIKMGFSYFWDRKKMDLKEVGWGAPDENVYNFVVSQVRQEKTPFFYHIITMTSHGPFTNASQYYNNKNYDDLRNQNEKNYLNAFSYVDNTLKHLIENIQDLVPETYFLIFGDHTVLIEGDYYFSDVRYKEDVSLFEFVPLIIISPEKVKYRELSKAVSFLDIAPTVLSMAGEGVRIKTYGENLLPRSGVEFRKKILYNGDFYQREYLFDKFNR